MNICFTCKHLFSHYEDGFEITHCDLELGVHGGIFTERIRCKYHEPRMIL